MTLIAVMTIPVAVLGAVACLYGLEQSVNVMTLAGLALAIGPLVDSAIICHENTHRHLGLGAKPIEAAYLGASEVALRRTPDLPGRVREGSLNSQRAPRAIRLRAAKKKPAQIRSSERSKLRTGPSSVSSSIRPSISYFESRCGSLFRRSSC
jgi:hypothetical protein